jgi:AbrB family looped-hinge helix DNA binding protein
MRAKSIRRLDGQGRVILPSHIRKALELSKNSAVTIDMTADGRIVITPAEERCCICGEGIEGAPHTQTITVRNETRYVCGNCFIGLHAREE